MPTPRLDRETSDPAVGIMRFGWLAAPIPHLILLLPLSSPSATEWSVRTDGSGDAPTIQAAIAAAAPGDRVVLEAGIFTGPGNRDVDFLGKAITVTSAAGAEATVIDCQGLGRGFVFQSGEDLNSLLERLTITHGVGQDPGGAWHLVGGAVACLGGSSPTISHCTLVDNSAGNLGGAIACLDGSSPRIADNRIIGNTALQHGGGIHCDGRSSPVIEGNFIEANEAKITGAGICCNSYCRPLISNNVLDGNTSGRSGGGVYCQFSDPRVEENVICGNTAVRSGGGICVSFLSAPTILRNTIVGNGAGSGGGIDCNNLADPSIEACIIAFNTRGGGIVTHYAWPPLRCVDIFGNSGGDLLLGEDLGGNFSADPLFCGVPESGNFTLRSNSPCLVANNDCEVRIGALPMGCGATPVTESTWGGIKARFRD